MRPSLRGALIVMSLATVAVAYLVVQAPPPLAAAVEEPGTIPIRAVFAILEHENDTARAVWATEIVAAGRTHGLAFDEHWRDDGVHAGPLPALFLRETARHLEREAPGLRLFLGSRFPINKANQFTGEQARFAEQVERTGAAQFFVDATAGVHTAMFADRAVAEACVRCHDEHRDSPKTDWKVGDIMGATTWMYPEQTVTMQRAVELVAGLRRSIRAAYVAYLAKTRTFPSPPPIGDGWPRTARQLPTEDVFMRELANRSSAGALAALLDPATAASLDAAAAVASPAPAATATPSPAPSPPSPPSSPPSPPATSPSSPSSPSASPASANTGPASRDARPDDLLVIRAIKAVRIAVEHRGSPLVVARLRAGAETSITSPPPLRVRVDDASDITITYRGAPAAAPEVEITDDKDRGKDRGRDQHDAAPPPPEAE